MESKHAPAASKMSSLADPVDWSHLASAQHGITAGSFLLLVRRGIRVVTKIHARGVSTLPLALLAIAGVHASQAEVQSSTPLRCLRTCSASFIGIS